MTLQDEWGEFVSTLENIWLCVVAIPFLALLALYFLLAAPVRLGRVGIAALIGLFKANKKA
jgi:hypothetical protein